MKDMEQLEQFYQAEKLRIEQQESRCGEHDWDVTEETYYVSEGYGYKVVAQGSDVWGDYEGYRQVPKRRFKRKCRKCGKVEYTEKTATVVTASRTEPVFG